MTFDPVKCEQLARWSVQFADDPGTSIDERVILIREAVKDVLRQPLSEIAEQLRAAVTEVAALNGVVDAANARVTTLTIAIRATATAARKAGLRATAELLQGLVGDA